MGNTYRVEGDRAHITTSNGAETVIDVADLPVVSAYSWNPARIQSSAGSKVLTYMLTRTGGKTVYLHRLIMDAPKGVQVDHINHDTLDNRRANLRLVSSQQNCMNRDGAYRTSTTGNRGVSTHRTNKGGLLYVFRCHGKDCKKAKYFPHTDKGLEQARAFAEAHYAGEEPPEWTLHRERKPPVRRPPSKLTDQQAEDIRRSVASGESQRSVAQQYGISQSLVSMICSGQRRYRSD